MKARIKATGEIIHFLGSSTEYGDCTWIDSKGKFRKGHDMPDIELLEKDKPIDWEQRRYEIAKESICAIMSNEEFYAQVLYEGAELNGRRGIPCNVSHAAVVFADALIEELKKTKK